jgi:DNA-binding transcriptional LysR family regulator
MSAFSPLVRYFEEVAEQGSIRRAAERMHIAPSAVTRQIAKFEEMLGMPLLERLPRGVRLTSAGEIMLANIRRMRRDFGTAINQVDALRGKRRGAVRIGMLQYMGAQLVPELIAEVSRDYPGISFTVISANTPEIVDRTARGDLDIGMCWAPPASAPLRRVRSYPVSLGVVVTPRHEWARKRQIALSECLTQPIILPTPDTEPRRIIDNMLRGSAPSLRPLVETNSIPTTTKLALGGVGVAVMTDVTVADEVRAGRLVHVPLSDRGAKSLKLELLVRAERTLEPMAAVVLDLLDRRFERYAGRT